MATTKTVKKAKRGVPKQRQKTKKMKPEPPLLSPHTINKMLQSPPQFDLTADTGLVTYTNIVNITAMKKKTIAGFDMDGTLITTKSGRVFPKDADDWKWLTPQVPHKLAELGAAPNTLLVIMSNQSGWNKHADTLRTKIVAVMDAMLAIAPVPIPFICMFATDHTKYRKPMTGMADFIATTMHLASIKGFYVGDAMTTSDHSQSDYYFALNAGLQFHYASNYWGIGTTVPHPTPLLPAGLTALVDCSTVAQMAEKVAGFDAVILVGPPACGKSTLAEYLHKYHQFEIMNNDTLPSKSQYNKRLKELLGKSRTKIVIDNTNPTEIGRKEIIDKLEGSSSARNIAIVIFNVDRATASYLNHYRCEKTGKWIPDIVYNIYYKKYEAPVPTSQQAIFTYTPCYELVDKSKYYV